MKTSITLGGLALALSLVSIQAQAQTSFGQIDCGQWVKAANNMHKHWLMGYLTGMNAAMAGMSKPTQDILSQLNSAEQAYAWVDRYCRNNPLDDLSVAGAALFIELTKKHIKK